MNELMHYGVLGMKWGVRESLTSSKSGGQLKDSKKVLQNKASSSSSEKKSKT